MKKVLLAVLVLVACVAYAHGPPRAIIKKINLTKLVSSHIKTLGDKYFDGKSRKSSKSRDGARTMSKQTIADLKNKLKSIAEQQIAMFKAQRNDNTKVLAVEKKQEQLKEKLDSKLKDKAVDFAAMFKAQRADDKQKVADKQDLLKEKLNDKIKGKANDEAAIFLAQRKQEKTSVLAVTDKQQDLKDKLNDKIKEKANDEAALFLAQRQEQKKEVKQVEEVKVEKPVQVKVEAPKEKKAEPEVPSQDELMKQDLEYARGAIALAKDVVNAKGADSVEGKQALEDANKLLEKIAAKYNLDN